jgi:hypothetical protein
MLDIAGNVAVVFGWLDRHLQVGEHVRDPQETRSHWGQEFAPFGSEFPAGPVKEEGAPHIFILTPVDAGYVWGPSHVPRGKQTKAHRTTPQMKISNMSGRGVNSMLQPHTLGRCCNNLSGLEDRYRHSLRVNYAHFPAEAS